MLTIALEMISMLTSGCGSVVLWIILCWSCGSGDWRQQLVASSTLVTSVLNFISEDWQFLLRPEVLEGSLLQDIVLFRRIGTETVGKLHGHAEGCIIGACLDSTWSHSVEETDRSMTETGQVWR